MRGLKLTLLVLVVLFLTFVSQQVWAQPKVKVKMAQVIHALSFAPTYVAMDKGFFAQEGIEVDFQLVRGGAAGKAAISGGSVEFCSCAGNDLLDMVRTRIPALGVHGIATGMTMNFFMNKAFLERVEKRGITSRSPLRERILALKNAKLGVTSLGGSPDLYSRWLIGQVGMDPKKDVENIAIGGTPELRAATMKAQIDGFFLSPPLGQQMEMEGQGVIFLYGREVAEFKDFIHEVLIVQKQLVEKDPDLVTRTVRAMARSNNFIQDQTAEASKLLQKRFAGITPDVLSKSVEVMKENFGRDGRMTEAMWKNAIKVNLEWREPGHGLTTEEGTWWTNKFIK